METIAHREVYWNIGDEHLLIFPLALLAVAVLAYAFSPHFKMWRMGAAEDRSDRPAERLKGLLWYGFANRRVLRDTYAGLMHAFIFYGMVVLFIGTIMDSAEYYYHILTNNTYLQGSLYLGYSLALDAAGVMVLLGLLMAAYRRYVQRPDKLDNASEDWISLGSIALIVVSGFLVEGFRISLTELVQHPDWAVWSPVGNELALAFKAAALPADLQLILHRVFWWAHMLGALGWVAYIFYAKLGHIAISPINIYFRNLKPNGALRPIPDMDNAETFGASTIKELTWKQLLDLDACTRCGRCQDNCPAFLTDKPLSPKRLTQDLKIQMIQAFAAQKHPAQGNNGEEAADPTPILGQAITEDAIWACTTCGACQEQCPVFVEHIQKVVDVRRNLVMMEGSMPDNVQIVLTNMERVGHPWAGTQHTRTSWMGDLGLNALEQDQQADLLYWVGCTGALESRSRKVTLATASLMKAAGVNFGMLGAEEGCCGDPARRLGNEYLFATMVEQNIEVLKSHRVSRIVTHCPHCFNSLKNEYPQFGADFEVMHHSQLLLDLIKQGKLPKITGNTTLVAYHDPCYLGRHNQIYESPRNLLKEIPGIRLTEMKRAREGSFCCGGGGAHIWMEETVGQRIDGVRTEQILETGANTIAVSCPFCLQMMETGVRAKDQADNVAVLDISELLLQALSLNQEIAVRSNT